MQNYTEKQILKIFNKNDIFNVEHKITKEIKEVRFLFINNLPGIDLNNKLYYWSDFFINYVLSNKKVICDYCENEFDKLNIEYNYHKLCDDCNSIFNNQTGYCSLDCCCSGRCDGSC